MSKHVTTFVFSILLLGGVCAGYAYLLHLEKKAITEAEGILAQGNELRATAAKVALLKNESAGLEADEALLASYFVRKDDIVPFLQYVERSGALHETLVEVASVSNANDTGTITLAVEIEGSFAGVIDTLADLEYGRYALSAKNAALEQTTDGTWKLRGNLTALSH